MAATPTAIEATPARAPITIGSDEPPPDGAACLGLDVMSLDKGDREVSQGTLDQGRDRKGNMQNIQDKLEAISLTTLHS